MLAELGSPSNRRRFALRRKFPVVFTVAMNRGTGSARNFKNVFPEGDSTEARFVDSVARSNDER